MVNHTHKNTELRCTDIFISVLKLETKKYSIDFKVILIIKLNCYKDVGFHIYYSIESKIPATIK